MAVIETWLRQDLKGLVTVRSLQGQVFSLDNGGNLIGVKVTKDGNPVTLTGTVTGYCILSDGQTVTVTGSGSAGIQNGNEAYIVLPQLVYSVPGQISIVIKLTSGSVTTTLAACTGYVYRSRTSNEVVPPGTPIPDLATLEEAISRANAAADSANTAATSANNAATAAERVNVAMSKTGKVITITATNRSGASTSHTVTESTLTVERENDVVTVTATDADGQTSVQFDAVDADEITDLKSALLLLDDIPDTVQTLQRNAAGKVSGIVHTSTAAGVGVVRTDTYVFSDTSVVETRTLASGESLTITVNKTTKETTLVHTAV